MLSIRLGLLAFGSMVLSTIGYAQTADIIADCDSCHGENGISLQSDMPTIGGVSAFVIEDYMLLYRNEQRPCHESKYRYGDMSKPATDMCKVAQALSEEATSEVAKYYSTQTFVAAVQAVDAEKAAAGEKVHRGKCRKCHSDGGSYADDDAGILAGQWMPYLRQAFADYASGGRVSLEAKMTEKMNELNAEQTEALIHYYASQQ
jgi:sulfide dehydrogenase cytochrome subunit